MDVKLISKNLRMLNTRFANAKKHIAALNLEQDAHEEIIETLDAQHLALAKKLMEPQVPGIDVGKPEKVNAPTSNGTEHVHVEMPKV